MTPNNYLTVQDIKGNLDPGIPWDADYEPLLQTLPGRASRVIDRHFKREPGFFYVTTDTIRYYTGLQDKSHYNPYSMFAGCTGKLTIDPLAELTKVEVDESGNLTYTDWPLSWIIPQPINGPAMGIPYSRLELDIFNGQRVVWFPFPRGIRITGKWGWSTTLGSETNMAAIAQAVFMLKRSQNAYQSGGGNKGNTGQTYSEAIAPEVDELMGAFATKITI